MTTIPRPMPDPCRCCTKADRCDSSDTYKCALFQAIFIRSWDKTVAFLKERIAAGADTIPWK